MLIFSIGFSIYRIVVDAVEQETEQEYLHYICNDRRAPGFDALFDDKDLAEQSSYLLKVWQKKRL